LKYSTAICGSASSFIRLIGIPEFSGLIFLLHSSVPVAEGYEYTWFLSCKPVYDSGDCLSAFCYGWSDCVELVLQMQAELKIM